MAFNEWPARSRYFETADSLAAMDDHLVASMHGDVLRCLASYLTDELKRALTSCQRPVARMSLRRAALSAFQRRQLRFIIYLVILTGMT